MQRAYVVIGSPAAGKTTYAIKLAREKSAALLDIDSVTGRMVEAAHAQAGKDPSDRDSAAFKESFREPIYETLFDVARENLTAIDVVVVGPFTKEQADPEWPVKLKQRLGAEVEVHYIYCSPDKRKERLARRGHARDKAKLNNWDEFLSYYGDEQPPAFEHIYVDTGK